MGLEQQMSGNGQDSVQAITQKCLASSTEGACSDASAQCQWSTSFACTSEDAAPTSSSACAFDEAVAAGEAMAQFLGPVGVQGKKGSESKTQTACQATPKGPVYKAATDTGTGIQMSGALTIGVIVSLMMYS